MLREEVGELLDVTLSPLSPGSCLTIPPAGQTPRQLLAKGAEMALGYLLLVFSPEFWAMLLPLNPQENNNSTCTGLCLSFCAPQIPTTPAIS